MRRWIAILVLLIVAASACYAQVDTVYYRDEAILAWNEMTEDAEGQPLLDTDTVVYEVYLYDSRLVIDDQDVALLTFVGETLLLEMEIDFGALPRVMYYAGVRARVEDGTGGVTYSDIAWSYDPVATDPTGPFAYIPLGGVLVLPLPAGLRDASQ